MHPHDPDHDLGLAHDLDRLLTQAGSRRGALRWLIGGRSVGTMPPIVRSNRISTVSASAFRDRIGSAASSVLTTMISISEDLVELSAIARYMSFWRT